MRRSLLAAPLIAAIAFGACDEASAPQGSAGDVTVLAFIDNDASGSMTAGDQPVAGLAITISRDGIVVDTENTDASGSVTFAGLAPGSYRVESSGTLPPGATLVSNSEPTAVINFRGDPVTVAFQYAMQPGTISGVLLREGDNAPAEGVLVVLKRAGSADTLARTTTSATGAYVFRLLGPGDYVVEFEQAGAINYGAAGRTRTVTVTGGGASTVNVAYTGSVFITIAAARAAPAGQVVAVIGDVTVPGGRFTSSTGNVRSEIWVQDDNAGIAVFFVPTADSALYPVGQRVEVVGVRSANGLEPQIGTVALPPTVRLRTGGVVRPAKTVTGASAKALADEGLLVRVPALTVIATTGTGAFNVRTRFGPGAGDTLTLRVNGTFTGLTPANFVTDSTYDVTGIEIQFNGTPQIKPRGPADVVPSVGVPRLVISEFIANPAFVADNLGEWIEVYNPRNTSIDLMNWTMRDSSGNSHTIASSVIVPAGGFAVLGVNGTFATNGGVVVNYVYPSGVSLNQGNDWIVLRDALGVTVDSIAYPGTIAASGRAVGVRDPLANNDNASGANWQVQTTLYNTIDTGTPGAPNDGWVAPAPRPRISRSLGGPMSPLGGTRDVAAPLFSPASTLSPTIQWRVK